MSYNLGKIKRVNDLRSVWPHEANDFTKWLSHEANLEELGNNIGTVLLVPSYNNEK